NEFFRSQNPEPERAQDYWKQMADKSSLGQALELTGFGLFYQGWDARHRQKNEQVAKKKFEDARLVLSEALKLGQKSSKLYLYLGLLYFEQEEYVHAAANFEETTKLNPSGS